VQFKQTVPVECQTKSVDSFGTVAGSRITAQNN
jgi:hypothetical protein